MKLNKFVCYCGHVFYDSQKYSRCDSCGEEITVGVRPKILNTDKEIPLVEGSGYQPIVKPGRPLKPPPDE